jgi:hypothetical protein
MIQATGMAAAIIRAPRIMDHLTPFAQFAVETPAVADTLRTIIPRTAARHPAAAEANI